MTSSARPYLITGATGGLGSAIVSTLLSLVPASSIIVSSSSEANAATLQTKYPGTAFRIVNYDSPESLDAAFDGIGKLFFVSSNVMDPSRKAVQHQNVVNAAKNMGVGHVYYSSQAFGGYGSTSSIFLQQSHLATEKALKESGIPYTTCRCSVYTEGFPIVLSWYPETDILYLPEGINPVVTFTSRDDLGAGIAHLMAGKDADVTTPHKDNIALLTSSTAYSFTQIAEAIGQALGKALPVKFIEQAKWSTKMAEEDAKEGHGNHPKQFFDMWLLLLKGLEAGEARDVDPLLKNLIGDEPKDTLAYVKELVWEGKEKGDGYRWPPRKAKA